MVERDLLERELRLARDDARPRERLRHAVQSRGGIEVRQEDHALQRRQLTDDLGQDRAPVERLSAVAIAVDGEHHLRLDLLEPVHDRAGPHVGRAARPDRAETRHREKRHDGLRDVRHVGSDAVARPHAELAQGCGDRGDLPLELGPGHLGRAARFRAGDDRRPIRHAVQEGVLGVVEPRALEPLRARHPVLVEHPPVGRRRANPEEVPQRRPEVLEALDRPAMERLVVVEAQALRVREPAHVARELARLRLRARRRPEHGAFGDRHRPERNAHAPYSLKIATLSSSACPRCTSIR